MGLGGAQGGTATSPLLAWVPPRLCPSSLSLARGGVCGDPQPPGVSSPKVHGRAVGAGAPPARGSKRELVRRSAGCSPPGHLGDGDRAGGPKCATSAHLHATTRAGFAPWRGQQKEGPLVTLFLCLPRTHAAVLAGPWRSLGPVAICRRQVITAAMSSDAARNSEKEPPQLPDSTDR